MSRSRKKSPFTGFSLAESDKPRKQEASRKLRRAVHQTLDATLDGDALPVKRYALTNPFSLPKDGKQWVGDAGSRLLNK